MNFAASISQTIVEQPAPQKAGTPAQASDNRFRDDLHEAHHRANANDTDEDSLAPVNDPSGNATGAPESGERPGRPRQIFFSMNGINEDAAVSLTDSTVEQQVEIAASMTNPGNDQMTVPQAALTPRDFSLPQKVTDAPNQAASESLSAGEIVASEPAAPAGTSQQKAAQTPVGSASGASGEMTALATSEGPAKDPAPESAPEPDFSRLVLSDDATRPSTTESLPKTLTSPSQNVRPMPTIVPLDHVAVHIARSAASGLDRIQIHLTPASLGTVDVDLGLAHDGRVDAVVRVDRPETLELLQRDARQLVRALQDAGLQADGNSLSFELRDQGGRQQNQMAPGWQAESQTHGKGVSDEIPDIAPIQNIRRLTLGGVDIIA